MSRLHEVMEVLIASWLLSGDEQSGDVEAIPTSHGVLDQAFRAALEKGAYQQWKSAVNFVESRIGMQCLELPQILTLAQRSELTAAPNPSYRTARIKISSVVAEDLLDGLGVTVDDAKKWGKQLRFEVSKAQKALQDFPSTPSP